MAVEFYRDTFGIPHIRASSEEELVFAQGYNVALDRPLQIEVERHRATGTTASFLGPNSVTWDVFARQAKIEDTAYRCFRNLRPSTRAWVRAYVAGVNRGLETLAPNLLADHGIPRGRWAPWIPLAIWLSRHILFTGFPSKLWREEVAMKLGVSRIHLFSMEGASGSGSNGWLIPGPRTASGAAILAGDPHLVIEEPGAYQQLRLSCPAYDVVGFAAPGVPGLPHYAHTGTVAWGITRAMAETQDLYREELRRVSGSLEARGPQGFRPVSVETQFIEVLGEDPVPTQIVETDRGVVIVGGPDEDIAISLRHPARVFGSLGFDALPDLLRSRTVADVQRSFQLWVDPVNVVQAADVKGGLLHQVIGTVPLRSETNMLRVVPAWEPQRDWSGEVQSLPRKLVEGPVVMANQRGIVGTLGVEFASEYRAQRIEALLETRERWAPGDMAVIHGDTQLDSASPLLDSLSKLTELSPQSVSLRERLHGMG